MLRIDAGGGVGKEGRGWGYFSIAAVRLRFDR